MSTFLTPPWPPSMDADATRFGQQLVALYAGDHGTHTGRAVDVLGWMRWGSDYRVHRANGLSHDAAWTAIETEILRIWGVSSPVPVPAPVPIPPAPGAGRRLVGQLRVQGQAFVDDAGPILPLFCHFGEAFSAFTRRPEAVRIELAEIAAAGYQGIRFWDVLGYHDQHRPGDANTWTAWAGREVTPVRFTAFSGRTIEPSLQYYDLLAAFLRACQSVGLAVQHSRGDLNAWTWAQIQQHCALVGDVQRSVGVATIALNEACNESWQNGVPEPARLRQMVDLIGSHALRATSAADDGYGGELPDSVDRFAYDVHTVHGYRGGDSHNRIAHIHALGLTLQNKGKAGWQGEPAGPGDGVSVGREAHPEALCLMAAMALVTRQAWVYMSGHGVFWNGPIAAMPGFHAVARVPSLLPPDVMTWPTIIHGGTTHRGRRVLVAHPGHEADPVSPFYRADQVLHADGRRFVCLLYGDPGTYRVPVERSFEGEILTPHTGERHAIAGHAGGRIDVACERGRILVGRTA